MGGSRIFSRKKNRNLIDFFQVDQIDFLSSPITFYRPLSRAAGKLLGKHMPNRFSSLLEGFDLKKLRLFGAQSPSKLLYSGAEDPFRQILEEVVHNWKV